MRTQTFISSIVGVVAAAAVAGSVNAATVIDNFATSFGPGYSTIQSGAGILGERTTTNGTSLGAGLLTFTNPGINWQGDAYISSSLSYTNFDGNYGTLDLTNALLTMTGSGSVTGTTYLKVTLSDNSYKRASWEVAFSSSINMSTSNFSSVAAGFNLDKILAITVETGDLDYSSTVNYTMTNFSYSSVSVPAPGAAALIGLAGAFMSRRRRN